MIFCAVMLSASDPIVATRVTIVDMSTDSHLILYAIYTRQSVDGLFDFSSCQAQFNTCQQHIEDNNEPGLMWICRRFDDEGYSGATLDRPAMQALRALIERRAIHRIYAVCLDRLSRNLRDALALLQEWDHAGVELHLVWQPELTSSRQNRFLTHMVASFAEFERDMIATRIAESRTYLKKHGRRLAGKVPYGYDADPVTKQLVLSQAEAEGVREIFERAAQGQLPTAIAAEMNARGWRTKVYHSRRSGNITGGGRWTGRQVLTVLHNPVYIGQFADRDGARPGCHEAIVTADVFEAVQCILASRRTTSKPRHPRDGFMLRQKLVCPGCGRFLTTHMITRKVGRGAILGYPYYSCRSTAGGRPRCKGIQYPAYQVDNEIARIMAAPQTWADIVSGCSKAHVAAGAAWTALSRAGRADFIGQCVDRIEFDPDASTASIIWRPAVYDFFAGVLMASGADSVNQ